MKVCFLKKLGVVAMMVSGVAVVQAEMSAKQKQQVATQVASQVKAVNQDAGKMSVVVRDAVQKNPDAIANIVGASFGSFDAKKNPSIVREIAITALMSHESPYKMLPSVTREVQLVLGDTDVSKALVKDIAAFVAVRASDSPLTKVEGSPEPAVGIPFRALKVLEDERVNNGGGNGGCDDGPVVTPPPSPDVSVQ